MSKKHLTKFILLIMAFLFIPACTGKVYKIENPKEKTDRLDISVEVKDSPLDEEKEIQGKEEAPLQVEEDRQDKTDIRGDEEDKEDKEDKEDNKEDKDKNDQVKNKQDSPQVNNKKPNEEEIFKNSFDNNEEYNPDINIDDLSKETQNWGFKRNKDHEPVKGYYSLDLEKYRTYYLGDTEEKVVYLTFDEGYENGYTPAILDSLKRNEIKAAFFVTGSYVRHNPDLIKRIQEEGHLVCNHSNSHPDFSSLTDDKIVEEIEKTANEYEKITGLKMDPFFRFPSGKYSERSMYIAAKMGYRNIFWSIAYKDWDVNDQPGKDLAYKHLMDNHHKGAIILLHAVSSSNAEAMDDILKGLKDQGYRFGSLYELD